jgi:PDZ domain-containing protein
MTHGAARTALAALLALALACGAAARARAGSESEPCDGGVQKVGDLGIAALDCDCTYSGRSVSTDGRVTRLRRWTFRSEPQVNALREGGPAEGKLREGDVITAIDGVLITTREGSRRFAGITAGTPAVLTVRRDGREIPVRIVADAVCPEEALAPAVMFTATTPPTPPTAPTPATAPTPQATPEPAPAPEVPETPGTAPRTPGAARLPKPAIPTEEALPRGWSGFGLTCRNCGGQPGEEGQPPVWAFGTLPTIYFVDPGSPAARAGLRIGDVLAELDGVSLLTEDGGKRFGALQPGQSVKWTIRRGGRVQNVTVVTARRPGEQELDLSALRDQLQALSEQRDAERMSREMSRLAREMERTGLTMRQDGRERLRYAGAVGGSEVEVRGLESVVVDDNGEEIVITTRDATIRIKKAAATAPKAAAKEEKKK